MHRLATALCILAAVAAVASCDDWECGCGGPGCGEPALLGLCEARLQLDHAVTFTPVFFDDTGDHPAELVSFQSASPTVLTIEQSATPSELRATGIALGDAPVEIHLGGWDRSYRWTFTVQSEEIPASDCSTTLLWPDGSAY